MATALVLSALAPASSADPARDATVCADLSLETGRRFDACSGLVADAKLPVQVRFEAYLRRAAISFMEMGDYLQAIDDTTGAIKLMPEDPRGYAARGNYRNAFNEYDKAVTDLSEAIRLQPDLVNAYAQRAYAYVQLGDSDKAIADYSQVIARQPGDANTHYDRGGAYEKKGDFDHARADYEQAIKLQRDYAGEFPDSCFGMTAQGERGLKNWPACEPSE